MFDIIAFDADDTLWKNEHLYQQGRRRFQEVLAKYIHPDESGAHLDEIEVHNIQWYGYGIKSFVLSMIQAAIEVSGRAVTAEEIHQILQIASEMIRTPVNLFEDTRPTLEVLHKQYPLMLITKGDTWEQYNKIQRSGIMHCFRYIEIVPNKTDEIYRSLLEKYSIEASRFLMVGNSLRSDILPVLNIGGHAVFIPQSTTWQHEHVPEEEHRHLEFAELNSLSELPHYLDSLQNA